jgi:hypothetical protein
VVEDVVDNEPGGRRFDPFISTKVLRAVDRRATVGHSEMAAQSKKPRFVLPVLRGAARFARPDPDRDRGHR